jgi:arylsulfatase A-like enzyme
MNARLTSLALASLLVVAALGQATPPTQPVKSLLEAKADDSPEKKPAGDGQKPNIVFVLMDNLGYGEVGVYGGGVTRGAPTPRIDTLATEGTRLTNFNVEAQCTPSRSAIMTGRFSIRSGTHSVPIGGGLEGLTQWEVTIAETLSGAGYTTAVFGKWQAGAVAIAPQPWGLIEGVETGERDDGELIRRATVDGGTRRRRAEVSGLLRR